MDWWILGLIGLCVVLGFVALSDVGERDDWDDLEGLFRDDGDDD